MTSTSGLSPKRGNKCFLSMKRRFFCVVLNTSLDEDESNLENVVRSVGLRAAERLLVLIFRNELQPVLQRHIQEREHAAQLIVGLLRDGSNQS